MFITEAFAQTAQAPGGAGSLSSLLIPMIAIFIIMYLLILRPQQQRMKAHRDMISALKRGDVVVTAGGLIGKVIRVTSDDEVLVELAEGVRVRVIRMTISEVRTRTDVREVDNKRSSRKEAANDDDENDTGQQAAANDTDPKKD